MDKPLRHIAVSCGVLMMALLVRVTWVQFAQSDSLANDPHNRRVQIEAFAKPRGDIIVAGESITGSEQSPGSDFKYKRVSKNGPMYAPITGYFSQAQGASFLEGVHNDVLSGKDSRLFTGPLDMLTGTKPRGGDVLTTIDPKAQKAAYKGLTDLNAKGAVVALDPGTGKILAMASTPSYDPSVFAGISGKEGAEFKRLDQDKEKPLSNRALRETYPPGSTFKILTAAAALDHGTVTDINAPSGAPAPYRLPLSTTEIGNVVPNSQCDKVSMKTGMQWSCNNVFLDAALRTGKDKMRETAEKFGFNKEQFTPVRSAASGYPAELDQPQTALTGMGQGSVTSTPLQMAMVTAGLANNGKVMKPYMVEELRGPNLSPIDKTEPEVLNQAVSEDTAKKVQEMMEYTVSDGTGSKVKIDGVTVGGKPGTAQHGADVRDERPYAWFVSYAKQSDGTSPVAVAVLVDPEDMDISRSDIAGGRLGAPIAKAVMEAVLKK
ncbi:penicillin-binding protein 2 [Streptomyces kasugaensis]|uniref:Penicillin-binding protein 2 n=1 Tax=Streptomyces kasugaensis TaxID=1946 RepID=A0A4Q9HTY5_STRKA|nr:penicillin-binding protein 2 [Streptomyces kasugaensis]TBO58532.1 penicillin-binding protein 2 [Streptomyces kasugaensis]WSK17730.1 penicillin-binding protein 2 [Streptomyces celluloflavus]